MERKRKNILRTFKPDFENQNDSPQVILQVQGEKKHTLISMAFVTF